MKNKSFYLLSLGCAKNTVDSESMSSLLREAGFSQVSEPKFAEILIVNTCGFIQASRQESIDTLKILSKKKTKEQRLIAAGCLPERIRQQICDFVPGINAIISTRRWMDIVDVVNEIRDNKSPVTRYHLPDTPGVGSDEHGVVRAAIQGASAYLKIADGCRRPCAFCSIPLIKGTAVSRSPELIIKEVDILNKKNIKELILIAQDTTDYGYDLGIKNGLAYLLKEITSHAPQIPWIRILYAYPGYVTDELINIMAENSQILHYLDIPLQHAHPETLKRMRRPANMDWVINTINKMRNLMTDLVLRTTFIVGYPGETEDEFQTLLDFISEVKFDRVGAFSFSFEDGSPGASLGDPIPDEIKQDRLERLMLLQENISLSRNQQWIGKCMQVLIEGQDKKISIGRSYRDAPEIDGLVIIDGKLHSGEIVPIQITGALVHDLIGQVIKP